MALCREVVAGEGEGAEVAFFARGEEAELVEEFEC